MDFYTLMNFKLYRWSWNSWICVNRTESITNPNTSPAGGALIVQEPQQSTEFPESNTLVHRSASQSHSVQINKLKEFLVSRVTKKGPLSTKWMFLNAKLGNTKIQQKSPSTSTDTTSFTYQSQIAGPETLWTLSQLGSPEILKICSLLGDNLFPLVSPHTLLKWHDGSSIHKTGYWCSSVHPHMSISSNLWNWRLL